MTSNVTLAPSRTAVTSFSPRPSTAVTTTNASEVYETGVWVLFVESKPHTKWLCCALSNGDVHFYDKETLRLDHTFPRVHGDAVITDLSCGGPNVMASSGTDGRVRLFDVRQPSLASQFYLPHNEEALSVALGYDGALAAVGGSKAKIHFHDIRNAGARFGSYQDSHTEEVTRVRFQPGCDSSSSTPLLLSASEDGLACVFDTSQPSEEAALRSVLNVQTPLREVGFFGPSYEGVYCLTGSETMSVWHHDSAQPIFHFGSNVRGDISLKAGGMQVDYLVDCGWDARRQQLALLAGNHSGDCALYQVEPDSLSLLHIMNGGHRGDVRSFSMVSSELLVTAGEDARLCEWNRVGSLGRQNETTLPPPVQGGISPSRGSGPVRKVKKPSRDNPY